MPTDNYADLEIVRRYVDEIAEFIDSIIHSEAQATILACEVFIAHKKSEAERPFACEDQRQQWLKTKAGELAANYLHRQHGKIRDRAIRKAVHDYPASNV